MAKVRWLSIRAQVEYLRERGVNITVDMVYSYRRRGNYAETREILDHIYSTATWMDRWLAGLVKMPKARARRVEQRAAA